MISKLLRTLVGLSIVAIGTLVSTSATAQDWDVIWKNYANENFCLGNTSGDQAAAGSSLWIWACNGNTAQTWSDTTYPWPPPPSPPPPVPFYEYLWTNAAGSPGDSVSRCAYTSSSSDGAGVVLEQCYDQATMAWQPNYSFNDSNGHPCYYWKSLYATGNAGNGPTKVMGVSGANMANGTHVIIWDFLPTHPDQYWCRY